MSVGVYDNSGENLKSASGFNYTISLSLSPYGQFLSDGPQLTKGGIAVFENLRIVSGGTYKIVPQSEGITIVEEYPVNISNYVHQVILKPQTISANFSFNVEIELYAETCSTEHAICYSQKKEEAKFTEKIHPSFTMEVWVFILKQ